MNADIQHIMVIESLDAGEPRTGSDLYIDVIERLKRLYGEQSPVRSSTFREVTAKDELLAVLDSAITNAGDLQQGLVIHFEMHGSAALDGLVTASGELVSWAELVEKFRTLNIATQNGLYLTMATCYGRHLFEAVEPALKSPYRGYISASQAVTVQEVMDSFADVYERLMTDGNLIRSYLASDAERSRFFYKDSEETFRQLMEITYDRMQNDPTYRDDILDNSPLRAIYDQGLLSDELLRQMMHQAFFDILKRHKAAFEF